MYPAERHDRDQHLCFLLGFTSVDREGRSASHFPFRKTRRSTSISQTFRSWVAIFYLRLRRPASLRRFISLRILRMPGFASLMNVLFWGRCNFHIRFSSRNMFENVWTIIYLLCCKISYCHENTVNLSTCMLSASLNAAFTWIGAVASSVRLQNSKKVIHGLESLVIHHARFNC